jgi:hypothetical protein
MNVELSSEVNPREIHGKAVVLSPLTFSRTFNKLHVSWLTVTQYIEQLLLQKTKLQGEQQCNDPSEIDVVVIVGFMQSNFIFESIPTQHQHTEIRYTTTLHCS